jgi:hypothetical protein
MSEFASRVVTSGVELLMTLPMKTEGFHPVPQEMKFANTTTA